MESLLKFLNELDQKRISHRIDHNREEAVMVEVFVPGEHWEVEFFADGSVEIEVYRSDGKILDESAFDDFWKRFGA